MWLQWLALGVCGWAVLAAIAYVMIYPLLFISARWAQREEDAGIGRRS